MKKLLTIWNIFIAFIVFMAIFGTNLNATTGKLKGATLDYCNGSEFGSHGDGHWHISNGSGYAKPSLGQWSTKNEILVYLGCQINSNNQVTNSDSKDNEADKPKASNSSPSNNMPKKPILEKIKSTNTSIKSINFDNSQTNFKYADNSLIACSDSNCQLDFDDKMKLATNLDNINIRITLADNKSKIASINDTKDIVIENYQLVKGANKIEIEIEAAASNKQTYSLYVVRKDDNTNLKNEYMINDKMTSLDDYSTEDTKADIQVYPASKTSKLSYKQKVDLDLGLNILNVIVTSEFGNKQEHQLNITRLKSSNSTLAVTYQGEDIQWVNCDDIKRLCYGEQSLKVQSDVKNTIDIPLSLKLANEYASLEVESNELSQRLNEKLVILVTAQNGDTFTYTIDVDKDIKSLSKNEIVSTLCLSSVNLLGACVVFVRKRNIFERRSEYVENNQGRSR